MQSYAIRFAVVSSLILAGFAGSAWTLDLSSAKVYCATNAASPEKKAAQMLIEEVDERTHVRLPLIHNWPGDEAPVISVGLAERGNEPPRLIPPPAGEEGFRVQVIGRTVVIAGNSPLGTLFGAGYLLRTMRMAAGKLEVADDLAVATSPRQKLRGHQVSYRPKVNTYDGWTPAIFEQYLRDLAVFGTNAIELIPPRSDDDDDSPHFHLPKLDMMAEMSRIIAEYGLQVWIWYPAMDPDYSDPKQVAFALEEWGTVFRRLPRVDAVLVPGGDPGHTQPKYLMALVEKQARVLRQYHPKATWWISPQGFSGEWMEEFLAILRTEPAWLSGVAFGPQVRIPLPELRKRLPARYAIRLYPDITHSVHGEYTVPDWDMAYALSMGREIYNPRPVDEAKIFRYSLPYTIGAVTYSEGVNDDVNKILWSALGWNPDAGPKDILREYARYLVSPRLEENIAEGLLNLERNWRGPALTNGGVETTFAQFRAMERQATPQELLNWRFQQMLFRAYFDFYVKTRLTYETLLEQQALEKLRGASATGSLVAMDEAERILDRAVTRPVARDIRGRLNELAEAQYQSIRAQLSVDRYRALAVSRGASLDTADFPLNNRWWLKTRFAELRRVPGEIERLKGIDDILNRTNPGPGGYYDDLGNPGRQPHLEPGLPYDQDPAYYRTPKANYLAFGGAATGRASVDAIRPDGPASFVTSPKEWWSYVETRWGGNIVMRYTDLDRNAGYRLRVVYVSRNAREGKVRLVANDSIEIHPFLKKLPGFGVYEFDIPRAATRNGRLQLRWSGEANIGGPGAGPMIAEVFLVER